MLSQFLQFLFSGITVGATYALAALGFTLIYNASNVINFAQGEFIMLGGMLAGHDECGTDFVEVDGVRKMRFYGMSSREAMNKYAGGVAGYRASEGKEVLLDYRGPVENTLQDILGGDGKAVILGELASRVKACSRAMKSRVRASRASTLRASSGHAVIGQAQSAHHGRAVGVFQKAHAAW